MAKNIIATLALIMTAKQEAFAAAGSQFRSATVKCKGSQKYLLQGCSKSEPKNLTVIPAVPIEGVESLQLFVTSSGTISYDGNEQAFELLATAPKIHPSIGEGKGLVFNVVEVSGGESSGW